jgi:hypothetical protein
MFESRPPLIAQQSTAGDVASLDPAALGAVKNALSSALDAASGLDDPARIDVIRALEELACVATAAQASLAAELDESRRATEAAHGVPASRRGRGVAAEVALARRESHHRGQRHLGLAKVVARELPHTWRAWRAGRITEWKATLVARETVFLSRDERALVDQAVAGDAERLERMGDRELAMACQKEAYRLDPVSFVERRRQAEADRNVTIRPAPDAMVWLTALLPVKEGVSAYAALTRAADSARAAGDPRAKGQVMADTVVASVLAGAAARDAATTRWAGPAVEDASDRPPAAGGAGISLGLVMTDQALFGMSDEPAHVEGYGPIPAELAREIVADACSGEEKIWLRRLYTSASTGELVAADSRARAFRHSLGRFVQLRDQFCRTPWCDAPIRHRDHVVDHDDDGPTSADNAQGLCEACNYAKQAPGWRARPSPAAGTHEVETTTPTGHTYRSTAPPVVATIHERPIRLDLYIAS